MDFLAPFAPYYYYVYWVLVTLLTMSQFRLLYRSSNYYVIAHKFDYRLIIALTFFFVLFYGLRPLVEGYGYFGDTMVYCSKYRLIQEFGVLDQQGNVEASKDWLFFKFMFFSAQLIDVHLFFLICMYMYVVLMFAGCKTIDYRHGALLMLFCFGSFEFYPYAVNGVRNGIACSFVIMALAYLCKNRIMMAVAFSLIAIGFHKSSLLPIVTMFFTYYINKPRYMYIVWIGTVILSLLIGGYVENLLSNINYDDRLSTIIQGNDADGVIMDHRVRWDFLIYSSIPLLLGWYTVFIRKMYNKTYLLLLGTYIYANSFWVLAIRAIFSNRIAYLSWFIYPIVLAYPLLNFPVFKNKHNEKTAWILLGHFGFTTILWFLW